MSTRGNNPDPQASRNAARPAAPGSGGMVMLAAGAAARMVQAILTRLGGPYARPAARPLLPAVLWQHVARRLGYLPPASTPLGTASSAAPLRPPALDLVWRVRPAAPPPSDVGEEAPTYLAPRATPPAFPPARPVSPAAPVAPSSSAGSVLSPPSYAPPPPPSSVTPPPGRAAFVPSAPSPPQPFAALAPAFLVATPAPSAPVQRVPLWEQVARSPVAPVAPAPPIALARQVAYRMGQAPALPAAPGFTILGPAPVPEVPFVWRTRPPVASPMAVDDAPPAGPRVSLPPGAAVQPPPVAGSGTALPAPAPTSPVQRVPAATGSTAAPGAPALSTAPPSSIQVGYTPGPALVPPASLVTAPVLGPLAPLPRAAASPPAAAAPPVPVPTRWDQDLVWRVRPAPIREEAAHDEPAPRWLPVAAPVRIAIPAPTPVAMAGAPEPAVVLPRSPVSEPVATAPPTVEAAQHVVRLAYTPPPPPAPLWTGPAANLATELNRDLVAPGDLLARPARPWDQEPVAVAPQVVEAAASAPPSSDVPPLSMPLAAPARAATSPEAASGAADLPVAANPGLFSRLVDRVSTAIPLPEPIRLALESLAARPAARPSVPPAEAAPVPPPALSSAPAVEFPVAAPPSAPATMDSSQVPAAPAARGGPLSGEPAGVLAAPPAAPGAALSPAPVPPAAPRPAPAAGGFLGALVSRLLGGTPELSAPAAAPAPLDMPWVRRAAPPAAEADAAVADEIAPVAGPSPAVASATGLSVPAAPAPASKEAPAPAAALEMPGSLPGAAPGVPALPAVPALPGAEAAPPPPILSMPGPVESSQVPALPVESSGPLPADLVAAPATPAAPAAASEPARIPPAPAPLVEARPVSRVGGFLSAIAGRVLGNTPEPPASAAGPAPLDMPWARHPASPAAGEQDSAGEYEPAPAPLSVQRAVTAPGAPPAAPAAVSTPPPAAAAPVADSGPAVAMPAIPAQGDQFAVPVPGDLAAVPEAPAWVSTPAPAFDQPAGELAEAPAALPWMDLDSMTDVLARVQTPLVSTTPLSAGQGGLGSRIWGAFERALPGGGAPAAPIAYAWGAGSPVAPGAVPAAFVPAQPGGYRGPSMGSAASLPAYGPGAVAGIPAAGPGGPAPLLGRSPADFVPALSARSLTPAVPAPYFDAESAGEADAEVADPAQAWMAALDRMYGAPAAGSETMPLAVPYGGFVVPAAEASGVLPQEVAWVADTIGFESAPPAATPARRVWERPVAGPPAPMSGAGGQGPGFVPSLPGSAAPAWIGDTGSAEYDSEAAAWADVVAAAVESDYGAGVPALALAGEEQGVPAVQDAASGADHEAAGDAAGDLDELANSVYEIIRRRLEVERERDWA